MCSILVAIRQVTFVCKRSHVVSVFEFGVNFFRGYLYAYPFMDDDELEGEFHANTTVRARVASLPINQMAYLPISPSL